MKYTPALTDLNAFAAIVRHASFRKAADELGLSPSTLSHMMRTLEANMAVRLLNRTTRSVSPTDVGERLLARLQPVLSDLAQALDEVDFLRARPSGTLRINASEPAARTLLATVVPKFLARYPEMVLDLVTEGRLVDIVAAGFDAGIRLGEAVPQDMIAVKFGGDARFIAVAAPGYLADKTMPQVPDDLMQHGCIRFRLSSGKLFRWEFERHGQEIAVDVPGALILDNLQLMTEAAVAGLGIAYVAENIALPYLQEARLVRVLDDWCPSIPGLCLYYPGHRHVPPGLRAFIEILKAVGSS
jgi:DNA-binding transcriptional LysR family regulator